VCLGIVYPPELAGLLALLCRFRGREIGSRPHRWKTYPLFNSQTRFSTLTRVALVVILSVHSHSPSRTNIFLLSRMACSKLKRIVDRWDVDVRCAACRKHYCYLSVQICSVKMIYLFRENDLFVPCAVHSKNSTTRSTIEL